jgi:RND family efflux transporter MFP subunit
VKKGQTLARLVSDTLDAQVAQNEAALARSAASIAQAKSSIMSAEARLEEARNAYDRGKPLKTSGYLSESGMDQRLAAAKTAEAALASAKDGLRLAEAEKAQVEAQRREIQWRRGRTDIAAPADGVVSRRVARIGGYAAGAGEPMFRIIAKGEIELDAEVTEARLEQVKAGQSVEVSAAGAAPVKGTVRLVSPEIDKATRLGRLRVFIGDAPGLRIGAFARGVIETAKSRGLAVPASAILYAGDQASVQVVTEGVVRTRNVKLGLEQGGLIEVLAGLADGDLVVAKSGTFLRDGDAVRGIPEVARRNGEAG